MFIFFISPSLATFSTTSPSTFSRNPILLPPPSPFTSHFPCFPGQSLTALLSSLPFLTHPYNSHFFHLSIFLSTHIFPFLFSLLSNLFLLNLFLLPHYPRLSLPCPITIFSFSVSLQLLYTYIASICHTYIHI